MNAVKDYFIIALYIWSCIADAQELTKECLKPELPNGFVVPEKETYAHWEEVSYACEKGFKPSVNGWWAFLKCDNGQWSSGQCVDKNDCLPLDVSNAKPARPSQTGIFKSRTRQTFQCDPGYEMNGSNTAECNNGVWTSKPVCQLNVRACDPPPQIAHAMVRQAYQHKFDEGTTLNFICEKPYTLTGRADTYCKDGKWIFDLPVCRKPLPRCGSALPIDHGSVSQTDGEATFVCNHGYKLQGSSKITCKDGVWSNPPRCERTTEGEDKKKPLLRGSGADSCGSPPVPAFGDVENNGDGTATYQCPLYYKRKGDATITCRDGEWPRPPVCQPPCETDRRNNLQQYVEEGDRISLWCYNSYRGYWKGSATCLKGKISYSC